MMHAFIMRSKISKMSFVTKLFFSFLGVLMIPLTIVLINNYRHSAQINTQQAVYSNEKVLGQTAAFIEHKVASIENTILIISFNEMVQTVLKNSETPYRGSYGHWFFDTTDMKNIVYNSYATSDIDLIRLYRKTGPDSFADTALFQQLSDEDRQRWNLYIDSANRFSSIWIPDSHFSKGSDRHLSVVRKIPDFNSINKSIGIIRGDVSLSVFEQIIAQATTTVNTSMLLYDKEGGLLTSSMSENLQNITHVMQTIDENLFERDGKTHSLMLQGKEYFVGSIEIHPVGWSLVIFVPHEDIYATSDLYRSQLIAIFIILFCCAIPFVYLISSTITRRLRLLGSHMKRAVSNNFAIEPLENGEDEIGQLTNSFNSMTGKISNLLEEQYKLGYQIKNLELKVLQSLINPHFLYNTLDMIQWMAIKENAPRIGTAASALGSFYKLGLSKGADVVTLENELMHVQAYVNVQNMRFQDKIQFKKQIPQELLPCKMLKIILQPLVENAILHGIREKENEAGIISITANTSADELIITVEDDGVGMECNKMAMLLNTSDPTGGYGVKNIHERIRLYYGECFGLRFESKIGKGTAVIVTLPLTRIP